jgi:hypothetical protein
MVLSKIVSLSDRERDGQSEKIIGFYYSDPALVKDRKTGFKHPYYPEIIKN